ncbi:hypothetical protein Ancab_033321 [Ancistrocladus abbreviatus]
MKSRSHRLPISDPPDDWVDGSWTVDCICGVNFDDGEEMVNCDECGVWVHTRCSRFVKGEKSFVCDKCKSKNSRNDSEETEVAQLLIELPTKTIKMNNNPPYPLSNPPSCPRPYRLWAQRPYEERVHVQGIPGGDPALFRGVSTIFSAELWKCTGYAPKKFGFRYQEFPCWDEHLGDNVRVEQDSENVSDKGAGVLYSLSKESVLTALAAASAHTPTQTDDSHSDKKSSKEKNWEKQDASNKEMHNIEKKERGLVRPIVLQSGKRKREELGTSKDRIGKKKTKTIDREYDAKKNKVHAIRSAVSPSANVRQFELSEEKGSKVCKPDIQDMKDGHGRDVRLLEDASDAFLAARSNIQKPKSSVASNEHVSEALSSEICGHNYSDDRGTKVYKAGIRAMNAVECSPKTDDILLSLLEQDDVGSSHVKGEGMVLDNMDGTEGTISQSPIISLQRSESLAEAIASIVPEVKDNEILQKTDSYLLSSEHPAIRIDRDGSDDISNGVTKGYTADTEASDAMAITSQSGDHKAQEADKGLESMSECCIGRADEIYSAGCSFGTKIISSESKPGSEVVEDTSTLGEPILSLPAPPCDSKLVYVGKSSLESSAIVISRSSASDKCRTVDSENPNPVGKQICSISNVAMEKDKATNALVRDGDKHDAICTTLKERPKSSSNPASSHPSRTYPAPISKQSSSDLKDPARNQSSKTFSVESCPLPSSTNGPPGSPPTQVASHLQNKNMAPALQPRVEKVIQSSSKASHSSLVQPSASTNSPVALSDEELAFLLHQELNSSPRVPRIPRVRHAGSLQQLSSASATSMLIKRTCSSGGKEQYSFSRKKNKDARSARELDNDGRKIDRVLSSPDSAKTGGALTHAEANSESLQNARKSVQYASATATSSGPSSSDANEQKNSPRNNSDDDTVSKGPSHQTLPGLIAEIMSKGQRMSYEELCNAVLPHWHNLRKHNGERYAYSSHSQAVLDCLRNRTEWARLVDRGPKTNANRKRRKTDAEPPSTGSEHNRYREDISLKEGDGKILESNREEFPKGKRNARKRRRLALRGRGIKDVRKRRKTEVLSDDDSGSFSNSSEESAYSEDESRGGRRCPVGSEASGSSDEMATML